MTGPSIPGHAWVRALGAGGFADVHLYRQDAPARDVAIKVLRVAADAAGREALSREADALAAVTGHPAVVSLFAAGSTADGRPYLAMEYCPVSDLAAQARRQPLAVSRALDLMVQVSSAAETLHRRGLVHRDIKPANIMLTQWERPVLADFGATLPTGVTASSGGGFSLLWAPPEQQFGAPAHPGQDVWALAATTWTLLAGHSPFEAEDPSAAAVADRVRAGRLPGLGRPDAPPELEVALRRAMSVDPGGRTPSALEFAEDLRRVQEQLHLTPTPLAVRDLPIDAAPLRVDDNRTRVRGFRAVEPDPAATGFEFSERSDPSLTLPARGRPAPEQPDVPAPPEPVRSGLRPWVVALLVLLAVVVTAGAVSATLLGTGGSLPPATSTPTSAQPVDPIGAPPEPVAGLAGELRDGRAYWTWRPSAGEGLRYLFTITRPGVAEITRDTGLSGVDVAARSGSNCIEVVVVGADGRQSSPVRDCVVVE